MNFRTVADMDRAIARNMWKLDRSQFDCVVGIPRSGMLPASIIATNMQLPLATLEGYLAGIVHGRSGKPAKATGRILLVDDTSNKGGAMARAVAMLPKSLQVTRMAVYGPYQHPRPSEIIDIWLEDCPGPRAFSWNLWKHARLQRWAFDFDGVLCRDPTKAENDDGPRYREFLLNAPPLFLPTRPIGHIITARLEKYRPECEQWLARHGVQYAGLHMMQHNSKAERMAAGGRGKWKASVLLETGADMMIESCPKQSRVIHARTQKPVFCTGTMEMVQC